MEREGGGGGEPEPADASVHSSGTEDEGADVSVTGSSSKAEVVGGGRSVVHSREATGRDAAANATYISSSVMVACELSSLLYILVPPTYMSDSTAAALLLELALINAAGGAAVAETSASAAPTDTTDAKATVAERIESGDTPVGSRTTLANPAVDVTASETGTHTAAQASAAVRNAVGSRTLAALPSLSGETTATGAGAEAGASGGTTIVAAIGSGREEKRCPYCSCSTGGASTSGAVNCPTPMDESRGTPPAALVCGHCGWGGVGRADASNSGGAPLPPNDEDDDGDGGDMIIECRVALMEWPSLCGWMGDVSTGGDVTRGSDVTEFWPARLPPPAYAAAVVSGSMLVSFRTARLAALLDGGAGDVVAGVAEITHVARAGF